MKKKIYKWFIPIFALMCSCGLSNDIDWTVFDKKVSDNDIQGSEHLAKEALKCINMLSKVNSLPQKDKNNISNLLKVIDAKITQNDDCIMEYFYDSKFWVALVEKEQDDLINKYKIKFDFDILDSDKIPLAHSKSETLFLVGVKLAKFRTDKINKKIYIKGIITVIESNTSKEIMNEKIEKMLVIENNP
jgi:hypothetical protein